MIVPTTVDFPQPFLTPVHIRWSDLDPNRHVNNAKVASLLEEARLAWHACIEREFGVERFARRLFVVNLSINYRAQVRYGIDVAIGIAIERIGHTSFTLELIGNQGDVRVFDARSTQVHVDANGRSVALHEADRLILQHIYQLRGRHELELSSIQKKVSA